MNKNDPVSSSEKLLQLIKNGPASSSKTPPEAPSGWKPRTQGFSFRKGVVVGVDFDHSALRLVKRDNAEKGRVVDCCSLSYPNAAPLGSPEFSAFLGKCLKEFCGQSNQVSLWALLPTSKLDIWHITIPRTTKDKVANVVHWVAKKETSYNEHEDILDFEVQGDEVDKGIPKTKVMVYLARRKNVEMMKQMFSSIGFSLEGLTIAPFAIQNLFRRGWVAGAPEACAGLHIGREWSRIDVYKDGDLVLTRGIKTGTNSMVEALQERFENDRRHAASPPPEEVSEKSLRLDGLTSSLDQDGENDFDFEEPVSLQRERGGANKGWARETLFSALVDGDAGTEEESEQDRVFSSVLPAVERLVRQIERTFEYYSITQGKERVEQVFLSGLIGSSGKILGYIGSELGMGVKVLDPLEGEAGIGPIPRNVGKRVSLNRALGLSLSQKGRTPNLLFTFKDKEQQKRATMYNSAIVAVFLFLAVVASGVFLWQKGIEQSNRTQLAQLHVNLSAYDPVVNQALLLQRAAKVQNAQLLAKSFSKRYQGVAVISEVAALTPSNVSLLQLNLELGKDRASAGKALILDGFIRSDLQGADAQLASYMVRLKNSPLFKVPTVRKSTIEEIPGEGRVLHFLVNVDLQE
ncbi:MAG: hypothetical protein ACLFNV_09480 [Desulfovibrionales bacterium]